MEPRQQARLRHTGFAALSGELLDSLAPSFEELSLQWAAALPPPRKHVRIGLVLSAAAGCLCLLLLAAAALFALTNAGAALQLPYRCYVVQSGSMRPALRPGDVIVVRRTAPDHVRQGDIVTFWLNAADDSSTVLTHRVLTRVVHEGRAWFITKGDSNANRDPPIPADYLVGRQVLTLRGLGTVLLAARRHPLLTALLCLSLLVCLLGTLFWLALRPARQTRREAAGSAPLSPLLLPQDQDASLAI